MQAWQPIFEQYGHIIASLILPMHMKQIRNSSMASNEGFEFELKSTKKKEKKGKEKEKEKEKKVKERRKGK